MVTVSISKMEKDSQRFYHRIEREAKQGIKAGDYRAVYRAYQRLMHHFQTRQESVTLAGPLVAWLERTLWRLSDRPSVRISEALKPKGAHEVFGPRS